MNNFFKIITSTAILLGNVSASDAKANSTSVAGNKPLLTQQMIEEAENETRKLYLEKLNLLLGVEKPGDANQNIKDLNLLKKHGKLSSFDDALKTIFDKHMEAIIKTQTPLEIEMDRKLNLLKEMVAEYSKQHTKFETLDFEKNYKAKVYADFYNSKSLFSVSITFLVLLS